MHVITSRASFLWMRLMPLEVSVSVREQVQIVRFREC
ncbi:hypothetical protein GLYMA_11G167501v4 [Glycine max]|nr:hypothetical protein GLYMA_11G167501v4 [Glycine max]KAH1159768.1 hypothetical protein GYH30_031486 [Glycine max]